MFVSLFIWIARLGITQILSFSLTRRDTISPSSSTQTRPAIVSGLSSHVDKIIPPYFSVLTLT